MNKKHKIWQSHIPGHALGAAVVKNPKNPKDQGDIGFAIRFWKRALKDAGTLQEIEDILEKNLIKDVNRWIMQNIFSK